MSKAARPKYRKGQPPKIPGREEPKAAAQPPTRPEPHGAAGRLVALTPLAPLIVRSGRPFDDQAGADPARLPPPSTLAGCLRTAWARETGADFGPHLADITIAGPLLARLKDGGLHYLAPKPADALYLPSDRGDRCVRLEPRAYRAGEGADLPEGLLPVQLTEDLSGKSAQGPAWWDWEDLMAFRGGELPDLALIKSDRWSPPEGDRRTHVAIKPATQAADPGRLFQTEGLDLECGTPWLKHPSATSVCLVARCERPLRSGLVHLGGERRLSALEPLAETDWPAPPADWRQSIARAGGLTLTLLTPGLFGAGYRPGWLGPDLTGSPPGASDLRLQLLAAALGRWQPQSGWDLAAPTPGGAPRPSRKAVPAGATYWFRLLALASPADLDALWLASLCDAEQDRRDGFGLALPAPWTPFTPNTPA
jgi:CRISPR-associated protein Cmr3